MPSDIAPQLVRVRAGGRVIGLGIVVAVHERRFGLLPLTVWHLHSTGRADCDNVTIEYNGWLTLPDVEADLSAAFLDHVRGVHGGAHCLSMPGCRQRPGQGSTAGTEASGRLAIRMLRESSTWQVDLDAVRAAKGGYLSKTSANTRAKIRQSLKAYATLGPLQIHSAEDVETAHSYVERLRALHVAGWASRATQGAFGAAHFDLFHQHLVSTGMASGQVQLLRISAGEHEVGYLYNFLCRDQVLFYQCGFNYALPVPHGRPGLVSHALAIEHSARSGYSRYDFLAGESQYKQSLASVGVRLFWLRCERPSWHQSLESAMRAIRRRMSRRLGILRHAVSRTET